MQLLESRAWPNKHVWVYTGTYICTNTCAEHFPVALKQCFQQNFHEKLNATKACAACGHQAVDQEHERGHWPGICRPISRHVSSSQTRSLSRIPAGTCQPPPSGSAEQGFGTGTSRFHQGQLQQTKRGQSFGLQPKFQSLLGCNSHL